jgi:hypothetical protein
MLAIDTSRAPITSANFLTYVDGHLYDGHDSIVATRADNYRVALPNRPLLEIIQAVSIRRRGRPEGLHYFLPSPSCPSLPAFPFLPFLPFLRYLPPAVVDFSSAVFAGFGGRGRFIDRLTPFQNGSTLRSTS